MVELELDKHANIAETKNFDLKLTKDSVVTSYLYTEGKHFRFKSGKFTDASFEQTQMTVRMLSNDHLGGNANGIWTLQIKDSDVFTQVKSWKIIIRGH